MLWARYSGTGTFPHQRWRGELKWHCDAYWTDASACHPSLLVITLKTLYGGAYVRDARLVFTEGLAGSRPHFTMNGFKRGAGFNQQSAKVSVALRYEGSRTTQVVLSGHFCERGVGGQISRAFTLEGDLVEQGDRDLPMEKTANAKTACNVRHLAVSLEPLMKILSDEAPLPKKEAERFQKLMVEYQNGSCSTKQCQPGSCALREQFDWLAYHGYKDMRDALDFEKSGLHSDPPKLRKRPGIETLKLTGLKQPGHYNP